MPLRNVKKWSRYVKRTAFDALAVKIAKFYGMKGKEAREFIRKTRQEKKLPKAPEQKGTQKEKELLRFIKREKDSVRHQTSLATRIIVDTAIKEFGLNRKLNVEKLKRLRRASEEYVKATIQVNQIKNDEKATRFMDQTTGKCFNEIFNIVKPRQTAAKYADYLLDLRRVIGDLLFE